MNKVVLYLHIFPGPKTHGEPWKEVLRSSNAMFEKMQSTSTLSLGEGSTLNGKPRRPPNVLLIQGEAIVKLISSPTKLRLNSFLGFPYALDDKWALNGNWLPYDEKGLETNPLPSRHVNREAKRNVVPNQNLPSFISRNISNNPFCIERKALFLSGN